MKNQAILFALHKEEDEKVYAEEIDQISQIQDYLDEDHFMPMGFYPTSWKINSNNNIVKQTV